MKKKGAYGVVFQDVTRNNKLTPAAKGLYAYLASFCGDKDKCFPSVDLITREMGMGKDTFYRHINALVAAGVVEKKQSLSENGKFGRNVYRLTHEIVILDYPITENEDTIERDTAHKETNNNNININSINNNRESIDYRLIADMYNETCVSLPNITKLSDARKKAIKARLNKYSVDDLHKAFEKAEASNFLKGGNERNWQASFDWIMKDANLAKILDGNYDNKQKEVNKSLHPEYDDFL